MFYVVNLEQRAILCYRQGDRRVYGVESIAKDVATYAQSLTNEAHAVVPVSNTGNDALKRIEAPWTIKG